VGKVLAIIVACLLPGSAVASGLDGAHLGLAWGAPFVGLLLSIAVGQAAFPHQWERHFGKVTLAWIVVTLVPLALDQGAGAATVLTLHLLALDYLPFLVTIYTLYVIAGGIHVRTRMSGHPAENTILLLLGTLAAGFMGTPGATLLFLPVVLTSNGWRRHKVHTLVFLVFLVANMGGGLTPLGPPLLMGYLKGVDFAWTVRAMALPTAVGSVVLLGLYWLLDMLVLFPHEDVAARAAHREEHTALRLEGTFNILLLVLVILVLLFGTWDTQAELELGVLTLPLSDTARMAAMVGLAQLSLWCTPQRIRTANRFGWGPMREVAILFAGIFITMLPPLAMLHAGTQGAMGGLIRLVSDPSGMPVNWIYFVITGLLSGFLDNAPTFLVFFNVAGGDARSLMGPQAETLTAISAGAAFWGGVTYIGNAPNFMVRSIAEERGIKMPSFFAFMLWSVAVLLPVFALLAVCFFAAPGGLLAALAAPPVVAWAYSRRLR
jgi:Na+/H+ antiporter NhaD/arsenite permease-like protein